VHELELRAQVERSVFAHYSDDTPPDPSLVMVGLITAIKQTQGPDANQGGSEPKAMYLPSCSGQ
jgi:hypothetical protein